jgi:import inner membrane translocase subunit TIM23
MIASSSRLLVQPIAVAATAIRAAAASPSAGVKRVSMASALYTRQFSSSSTVHDASSPSSSASVPSQITWGRYLALRKQRRIAGTLTSIPTTLAAAFASGSYFLTQEIDPSSSPIAGIDPVYVYALLTISCTGLGYLVGPSLGSSIWSLAHRGHAKEIEEKDKKFYEHIVRNRVDPSRQTMQNRLPDYYGEKIGSVSDYRQWLRDQSVFREKAAHGVEDDQRAI